MNAQKPTKPTMPKRRLAFTGFALLCSLTLSQSQSITPIPSLGDNLAVATGLNDHGQVVGYCFLSDQSAQRAFLASGSGILNLGTLGGLHSVAFAINGAGEVIGQASTVNNDTHAFLFRDGQAIDLGTLGGPFSTATAINDSGQVVGYSILPDYSANRAFLFDQGTLIDLGTLGGSSSTAIDINSQGQIAGTATTASGQVHPFLYSNGQMTDLGSLGGLKSTVYDLNDSGLVVGEATTLNWDTHAFLALNGSIADLGTLGGTLSTAVAVNEAGQIAGYATVDGDIDAHGFLYAGGTMHDLGTLGGPFSYAYDINNEGQIVGESDDADGLSIAFLWQNGLMIDLNSLLPPNSGWTLTSAFEINEANQILGRGFYQEALSYFLLTLPSQNRPPVANAGPAQSFQCPGIVTLDGTQSSDPDNDTLTYTWHHDQILLGQSALLTLPLAAGTYSITLTVTDPSGATDQDATLITIADQTPPQASCPISHTIQAGSDNTASVPDLTGSIVATDNCAAPDSLHRIQSPAPGSSVGLGEHVITFTVSDPSGNQATCQTHMVVESSCSLHFLSLAATPNLIHPPNKQMIPVTLTVQAESSCAAELLSQITRVTSSDLGVERKNEPGPDWEITGPLSLNLRAAVSPSSSERTYTITVQCADTDGNTETRQVSVVVQKGKKNDGGAAKLPLTKKSQTR